MFLVKIQCKTDTFGLDLHRGSTLRRDNKVMISFIVDFVRFTGVIYVISWAYEAQSAVAGRP